VLGCIAFGAACLQKIPVKRALADFGLAELTGAESVWYILGCLSFGAAYFAKVSAAKAISELPQFAAIAPRNHLELAPAPALSPGRHQTTEMVEQAAAHREATS